MIAGAVPFARAGTLPLVLPTAALLGAAANGMFALAPHVLSQRFADAVRSFGMGLAYAVASATQALAGYLVPATGGLVGLAPAMEGFIVVAALLTGAAIARRPRHLPGADGA